MTTTSVLFLCPDNSLLGPLAEAYLNARGGGLLRAFSAGLHPAQRLNRHVPRLLSALGIDSDGLAPKPVDIFLLPHAIVPDRVIYLADMAPVPQPAFWKATTSSHWWSIAGKPPIPETFGACAGYCGKVKAAIDRLVEPRHPWVA
ncbi:low molecular weight phosphatase family protein [Roseibium sp.]|uniref:arsenate-mycothiol transferase ArsC n=1 Tax=Roseibium sp. TaxID=1936156 RepID=UPI003D0D0C16